jgi:hypothetical protein
MNSYLKRFVPAPVLNSMTAGTGNFDYTAEIRQVIALHTCIFVSVIRLLRLYCFSICCTCELITNVCLHPQRLLPVSAYQLSTALYRALHYRTTALHTGHNTVHEVGQLLSDRSSWLKELRPLLQHCTEAAAGKRLYNGLFPTSFCLCVFSSCYCAAAVALYIAFLNLRYYSVTQQFLSSWLVARRYCMVALIFRCLLIVVCLYDAVAWLPATFCVFMFIADWSHCIASHRLMRAF